MVRDVHRRRSAAAAARGGGGAAAPSSRGPARGVLHVIHDHGGGTETHVRALIAASRERWRHYLAIAVGDRWQVEEHRADGSVVHVRIRSRGAHESLARFRRRHLRDVRHRAHPPAQHLRLPRGHADGDGRPPRAVRLHRARSQFRVPDDHVPRRRRHVLRRRDRRRRVQPLPRRAARCSPASTSSAWRARHGALLRGAAFLIAPSRWAADMLERYFPGCRGRRSIAHGTPRRASLPRADRGAPRDARAARRRRADGRRAGRDRARQGRAPARAAGRARARARRPGALRADRLHGRPARAVAVRRRACSPCTAATSPPTCPALLAHYRVALVLYPSAGPETFSYTLSEAWAAGRPVLVPPIGALAERVRGQRRGLGA